MKNKQYIKALAIVSLLFFTNCSNNKSTKKAAQTTPGVGPVDLGGNSRPDPISGGTSVTYVDPATRQNRTKEVVSKFNNAGGPGGPGGPGALVLPPAKNDGSAPVIDVSPKELDFGSRPAKAEALILIVTATNSGGLPVNPHIQVEPMAPFYLNDGKCGPEPKCELQVVFAPEVPGVYQGTMVLSFTGAKGFAVAYEIKMKGISYDRKTAIAFGAGSPPIALISNIRTGKPEVITVAGGGESVAGGLGGVAMGDVNDDGVPDYIFGSGLGVRAKIFIYDGKTIGDGKAPTQLLSKDIFEATYTLGINVATGDFNGDKKLDILVGAANIGTESGGGGPRVSVFSGADNFETTLANFFPFESQMRNGINVAAGDVNGDGNADIIVGAGTGGGPRIMVYNGASESQMINIFAGDMDARFGVQVASGYINSDKYADIVVSTGAGDVRVIDGKNQKLISSLTPSPDMGLTVRMAVVSLNGDPNPDVIMVTGPSKRNKPANVAPIQAPTIVPPVIAAFDPFTIPPVALMPVPQVPPPPTEASEIDESNIPNSLILIQDVVTGKMIKDPQSVGKFYGGLHAAGL